MPSIAAPASLPRAVLAAVTAVALTTLPLPALGAPSPTHTAEPGADATTSARPETSRDGEASEPDAAEPDAAEPDAAEPDAVEPDAAEPDAAEPDAAEPDPTPDPAADPDGAPQADPGAPDDPAEVVDTGTLDDREPSTEAAAPEPVDDPEPAEALEAPGDDLPELSVLQRAGWWTLFGAFAVGTTAGVFAGLAERQEDRALRLATLFDGETGQQPLYADYQGEYEKYLRRGRAYERTAIGLGAVTGAVLITGIVLFAIDASRRRGGRDGRRARVRPGLGGWEVQF